MTDQDTVILSTTYGEIKVPRNTMVKMNDQKTSAGAMANCEIGMIQFFDIEINVRKSPSPGYKDPDDMTLAELSEQIYAAAHIRKTFSGEPISEYIYLRLIDICEDIARVSDRGNNAMQYLHGKKNSPGFILRDDRIRASI
jgi:hypothetical protein